MMTERKRFALFIDYTESVYADRLIKGASEFLKNKEVDLLVFPCGSINYHGNTFGYHRLAIASLLNKNNIDGLIFVCGSQESDSSSDQIHSYLKSFLNIPVVCIGHDYADYPCIINSSFECMQEIANHIAKKSNRKHPAIFIPKSPSHDILQRIQTYLSTMKELGYLVSNDNIISCSNLSYDSAIESLQNYKKQYGKFRFDSLVCMTDTLAFASIDFLSSCGIKIPEDIIITGFDDEADAIFYSPTLTSVNQNVEKQSYFAAKILYRIVFKNHNIPDTITIHSSVYYRQSTGDIPLGSDRNLYLDSKGKERTLKNNVTSFFESSKWNYNKLNIVKTIQLYTNLESGILIDELAERIESDFTSFKVNKAAIVLFDKPIESDKYEYLTIPSNAYVLSSYDINADLHHNINNHRASFNPNEKLIPEDHLSSLDGMVFASIYCNSILYGYLMYEPGNIDPVIYGICTKMLSSIIARASYSHEALEKKRQLELENSNIRLVSVTDEMTGLLNRRGFISHGRESIENTVKLGRSGLVLFGDMDGLKIINDTYGHAAGDIAIKAEAEILKSLFRSSDIIGRLGGDEFAIVAPDLTMEKYLEMKTRLEEKCSEYNKKSGESFVLSISIGCVEYGRQMEDYNIEKLLAIADDELYKEKQHKYRARRDSNRE